MNKINLYVVYEDKDLAKRDGAFFNPDLKTWQCEENNKKCFEKYRRIYLDIDYDKKEYVKTLGGKWDSDEKNGIVQRVIKFLLMNLRNNKISTFK